MSERTPPATARDLHMDAKDLWREEMITDRRIGMLRVLTPIKADGSADGMRQTIYVGEAQMMTNVGALPISFEIEAKTLAQAVDGYGAAAAAAPFRCGKLPSSNPSKNAAQLGSTDAGSSCQR